MKTTILFGDGYKQIVMTPETENEKQAIKFVSADDEVHTIVKVGNFTDMEVLGAEIYECQGGYHRMQESKDSIIFVLTPKEKKDKK